MSNCIFCGVALDRKTKPEHVLLNALGGRKTTTQIVCSACNCAFGSGIDKALAEQIEIIRNMLQMNSGSGNLAPMLRKVQAGGDTLNIHGDGTLEPVMKPFSYAGLPDGSFRVEIKVRSLDEIGRLIPNIAASLRIPEEQIRSQLSAASGRFIERRPGIINFPLSFGGPDAIRAAAKACLVLWALKVGNRELRGTAYDAAREFVTAGSDAFLSTRTALDSRHLDVVDQVKEAYGPLFNLIYVRSNALGRVIGHFTLCNVISFQIVLAESGGSAGHVTGLVSNPLSPEVWSDEAATLFDVPFEWLDRPDYDETFEVQRERISQVMKTYFDRSRPKELHRIMDAVFDKYGLGENDPIPDNVRDPIFLEISARIAAHAVGRPFYEPVTEERLRAAITARTPDQESRQSP